MTASEPTRDGKTRPVDNGMSGETRQSAEPVACCGSTERDRFGPIHARGCPTYEAAHDYGELRE